MAKSLQEIIDKLRDPKVNPTLDADLAAATERDILLWIAQMMARGQ